MKFAINLANFLCDATNLQSVHALQTNGPKSLFRNFGQYTI